MIVRCGRCRTELQVPGAGEFVCPACGTRNAVRGGADEMGGAGLGDLGGLTVPGGAPAPAPRPEGPDPTVAWSHCPSCGFRFAMGPVEEVVCPNCETRCAVTPEGLRVAEGS